MRCDFSVVFAKHEVTAEKRVDMQSTEASESLNQMTARKAPKSLHYNGSESLNYRVSSAIAQKNEYFAYVSKVS